MNIGIIIARKGSKRLKDKNMRDFNGVSLFEHSLKKVLKSKQLEKVVVCSDDSRIYDICENYGVEHNLTFIMEPEDLANQDNSWDVIKYVLEIINPDPDDIIVYLPSTSPLRSIGDIEAAIRLFKENSRVLSCISVCECTEPPEWSFQIEQGLLKLNEFPMTSQELKKFYYLNGSIYVSSSLLLRKYDGYFNKHTIPYIMPRERSIDIDTELDFLMALNLANLEDVKLISKKEIGGTGQWIS